MELHRVRPRAQGLALASLHVNCHKIDFIPILHVQFGNRIIVPWLLLKIIPPHLAMYIMTQDSVGCWNIYLRKDEGVLSDPLCASICVLVYLATLGEN